MMPGLEFILQSTETDLANRVARLIPARRGFETVLTATLREAVSAVRQRCFVTNRRIRTIYIVGHGSTDGQEFGGVVSDMLTPNAIDSTLYFISFQQRRKPSAPPAPSSRGSLSPDVRQAIMEQHAIWTAQAPGKKASGPELLLSLLPFFERGGGAQLILGGCRVGAGDVPQKLSMLMRDVLVSAFNMAQLPTGLGDAGVQYLYLNGALKASHAHITLSSVLSLLPTAMQATGIEGQ